MADIFVSYKKEDAGRVVRIVEGLRAEGLSVWWDHGIAPGSQWDQTIQT
ncbi:MAG: TIR domain-containing protein, partial [Pseudomonadota bacterium]